MKNKTYTQGGHIKIHSHSDIPVQVDGEPWIQPPGDVVVFNSALKVSTIFANTHTLDKLLFSISSYKHNLRKKKNFF